MTAYQLGQWTAYVTMTLLLILLVRRIVRSSGRARTTDVIAALECVFTELTNQPAYSTPEDFAALANEIQATQQLPAGYMKAVDACGRA